MEIKNMNIQNYINALSDMTALLSASSSRLCDKEEENRATIKTLNVVLESVRSETVILQSAIDEYFE